MAVRGYLVYVPFENIASMEYGNNGAPDKVTVATTPGHLAGPFEVHQTLQDPLALAEALRSAVKAGALRAITEYEADPATGEVLWPGEMSPRWTDVVNAAVARARENLSGKLAGQ